MEILIVSDSHGRADNLREVLRSHPNAKYLLFCGDGLRDVGIAAREFPNVITAVVRGNCDWLSDIPAELYFKIDGVRILLMHGHTHSVKSGMDTALAYAKEKDAQILIYGHTHIPKNEYVSDMGITLFNPGSLAERTREGYSYGVLEIRNGKYLLSHGNIK